VRAGALAALAGALALAACARPPAGAAEAGKAFLARNAHAEGVQVTASGLEYRVLRAGPATGARPGPEDEVKVAYEGRLLDGQVFDSSYQRGVPAVMNVGSLIPAWREALQLMRPGDAWTLWVPPTLGYGAAGAGPIPPNSVLVFKLELLDVAQ
jgi:peptidylprolyl isomerase/FKBP-type peptidyl-prolyl cis-trans isomerase FklB